MELILTEAEKKAATWLELDDESVGKLVKSTQVKLRGYDIEHKRIYFWSAVLMLCCMAAETNADKYTTTMEGVTVKGKDFGTWEICIKKLK